MTSIDGLEPVLLEKQYKDHTVPNAVDDISLSKLPDNAMTVHQQRIRNMSITIQIIDEKTDKVLETISGMTESGSVKVDSGSLIRRTADLTLQVEPEFFPKRDSLIWFNKVIKIYAGIEDLSRYGSVTNFLLGTFWVDEVDLTINENSRISVSVSDKMTKYDEAKIENPIKIEPNTPIDEAIKLVMENLGESHFGRFDKVEDGEVVPYTLEYKAGDSAMDIITALRDMYMDYVCGYNLKGEFEFRKIQNQKEEYIEDSKWRFDDSAKDGMDLTIEYRETYNLKNIKNRIVVIGGTSEKTGLTPSGEARVTDPKSPFNIYAIGKRTEVLTESKYVTEEQCISKAKFETWKRSNFQEKCTITCPPLYLLDAFDIIDVTNPVTREVSRYMIDSMDFGLSYDSTMSITAHKLYYVSLEYGEEQLPLVNAIINGIYNKGWISLAEERIRDCYNIMGKGTATLTIRFQDNDIGGAQASVISYPTTDNQTMLIDLADFKDLIIDDENGASIKGSKGDYLDRVIGHETFHVVTNDYFGHDTIVQMPIWFKEGFSEFIHGAKERFTYAFMDLSRENKKSTLIGLAEKQLNGEWGGTSEDYVAAYLLAIAIYRLSDREHWRNLFPRLKKQQNVGINFTQKLLPIAKTTDEVNARIIKELNDMNDVWNWLFNPNDIDTGSVGGIHFMNLYNMPLTAETVFNNANAIDKSIGFLIKIEK